MRFNQLRIEKPRLKRLSLIAALAGTVTLCGFEVFKPPVREETFDKAKIEYVERQTEHGSDSVLAKKIFPFIWMVQNDPQVAKTLQSDKTFQAIESQMNTRIATAIGRCDSVICMADAVKWQPKEVQEIGKTLQDLYARSGRLQEIVATLKANNYFSSSNESDTSVLRAAWEESVAAYHHIVDVYMEGKHPLYVKIDSISFPKTDVSFQRKIKALLAKQLVANKTSPAFLLPLQLAVETLQLNGRDEAIRYEPLNDGPNKLPFAKIKNTSWSSYQYSCVLIPGLGPEEEGVALAAGAIKRCEEGVKFYRKGVAPFIVVSGGNVHPFKTPFNEAVEMKKYLVAKLGIPDDAVFIEPHARHTTTNLRNTNRLLYRFGIPTDKPVLIVTDSSQSSYIVKGMERVALRDLGYLPYSQMTRINERETSYYPNRASFRLNPTDPLDP